MNDTVFEAVARQAARTPDAVAIVGPDGDATYGDVMARAAAVASRLRGEGLAPETPVAAPMRRRTELVGDLLGVWSAGCAFLPLDPAEPAPRAARMLSDAGCRLVLGDADLAGPVVDLADDIGFIDLADIEAVEQAPAPNLRPEALAYVMFTSGSTGAPKGVEVEHRAVANLVRAAAALMQIGPADRYLATATIAFDIAIAELFLPLTVGASLTLSDRSILTDPAATAGLVRETGVTVMQTGPSVWSAILDGAPDFPRLRVAVSTGEAVSPEMAARLAGVADVAWNLYGPTEATVWAAGARIGAVAPAEGGSEPIGEALEGAILRVVDEDLTDVPAGVAGELLIGGVCLARGYRNRPDLTAERFIETEAGRFYRTGDLVSRQNGGLQYFGRIDDQMQVRGVRVEPQEVESAFRTLDAVREAAVTWFDDGRGGRGLVAAVVPEPGLAPSPEKLRAALGERLPAAMVPARFLTFSGLPVTKSGKVDRAAIRAAAADAVAVEPAAAGASELTPTAAQVARIWRRMLGEGAGAPDAHFFAAGGDSLSAVVMTNMASAELGVEIPAQLILEAPGLADFAARIDALQVEAENGDDTSNVRFIFPMALRPGPTKLFFCGADLKLAQYWRRPESLYVLAYWADGANFASGDSIEDMAARYTVGMRKIQPQGPYRLAGFSFGAIVAFEMARQMRAAGDRVDLLFLLDPYKPFFAAETGDAPDRSFVGRLRRLGPFRRRVGLIGVLSALLPSIGRVPGGRRVAYWMFHMHARRPNPVSTALVARWRWPIFWFAAREKLARYRPKPYGGRMLVALTAEQGGKALWASLSPPDAEFADLETAHLQLFDEAEALAWQALLPDAVDD